MNALLKYWYESLKCKTLVAHANPMRQRKLRRQKPKKGANDQLRADIECDGESKMKSSIFSHAITSIEALSWRPGRFEKETDAQRAAKCKRCALTRKGNKALWRFLDPTVPCNACQAWRFENDWRGNYYILWACSPEHSMFNFQAESFENAIERLDRKRRERRERNHSKRP